MGVKDCRLSLSSILVLACLVASVSLVTAFEIAAAQDDIPADAIRAASGLGYKLLRKGTGTVRPGPSDIVSIRYTARNAAGVILDDSDKRNNFEPEVIGLHQTQALFGEGVQLMVAGEKRRLWVPRGTRSGELVIYDVELVAITGQASTPAPQKTKSSAPPPQQKKSPKPAPGGAADDFCASLSRLVDKLISAQESHLAEFRGAPIRDTLSEYESTVSFSGAIRSYLWETTPGHYWHVSVLASRRQSRLLDPDDERSLAQEHRWAYEKAVKRIRACPSFRLEGENVRKGFLGEAIARVSFFGTRTDGPHARHHVYLEVTLLDMEVTLTIS